MAKFKRRSQAQWLTLIEQQRQSGQSVREFCKARGLSDAYFSTIKKKFQAGKAEPPAHFVRATVAPRELPSLQIRKADVLIGIPGGCDPAWVAQLVRALCT